MKIRFRYLENSIIKDFFKDKSFKNFLKSGNYISDNIKNLFEQKLKKIYQNKIYYWCIIWNKFHLFVPKNSKFI